MKIVILAPSHKSFIHRFLPNYRLDELPEGYFGAPFIGSIIEELLSRGHQVIAITTNIDGNDISNEREFENGQFKWITVPARKHSIRFNGSSPGRILDFYAIERKNLRTAAVKQNPDFVHAHWSYEFSGAIRGSKIPHLVTIHDNPYQVIKYMRNAYRFGRLLMSEWVLSGISYTSTVSPYMLDYVKKRCPNCEIIPNPTVVRHSRSEVEQFIKLKVPSLSEPKLIMIMNGWDKRKNGEVGLCIFNEVKQHMAKATLHIFGNQTEEGSMAHSTSLRMGLDGVFFYGSISHDALLGHLSSSHLLVHPSLEESFGVVLIEAMALGVPVIGGEFSGAVPWVIGNKDLLVDLEDVKSVGSKIVKLLMDPHLYESSSILSYDNASKRFSSEAVVSQYETYYNTIINKC